MAILEAEIFLPEEKRRVLKIKPSTQSKLTSQKGTQG